LKSRYGDLPCLTDRYERGKYGAANAVPDVSDVARYHRVGGWVSDERAEAVGSPVEYHVDIGTATPTAVQRILVAPDTSTAPEATVEHAADLARAHRAELHVLYVKPSVDPRLVYAPDRLPGVDGHIERIEGRFPELKVHTRQELGDVAATICDVAEQAGSDVIVIGYTEKKGKRRLRRRSVPNRVIRHSPCSVLLVDLGGTR
jgi:nucleotide-binding universal stress UspA family protein